MFTTFLKLKKKKTNTLIMITYTSFLLLLYFLSLLISSASSYNNVSAVFAFGDSTMDAGNNNHLHTLFHADHLPYGRDFPSYPTGRFSNGKLSTDFIVHFLGLKDSLPAYLNPTVTDRDLLTGVTFASAGSGLDEQTIAVTNVIDMGKQFELFEEVLMRMSKSFGDKKANDVVENALFVISVGTNDMLYNAYLLPTGMVKYGNLSRYQDFLIQNLVYFVQRLHGAGARRIAITGLPPVGCLPLQVTVNSMFPIQNWFQRTSNEQQNRDSQAYNTKLLSRIKSLQFSLQGAAKIGYFDTYAPIMDMIQNPAKYGFQETLRGCCGTGLLELGPFCNGLTTTCQDASKYLFWDAVHPTQAGYWVIAKKGLQTVIPYLTS